MLEEPEREVNAWHHNGVWVPWAVLSMIGATLAEAAILFFWGGRLSEQVQHLREGQSSTALHFSAEHDAIRREITDIGQRIDDLKTAQAVDNEHTKTQDERITRMEQKLH